MPRDINGNYALPQSPFQPATTISSSAVNSDFSDIATALTQSIATTGVSVATAPIPFASGSAASVPGITHRSDTTSGLYNPAVGQEALVSGGNGLLVNSLASYCSAAVVANGGGSTYAVGDRITLAGGTYVSPVILTVATLSGSAIATVTVSNPGRYTGTLPTNPVSQASTTGSGSGATFTLTFTSGQVLTDATGANLGQAIGASPFATNTILQLASASDLNALITSQTTQVSGGGTGVTTLTTYAPIFGGTTSTGAIQQTSVGTSGQVLTSNGAAALPTMQDLPSVSFPSGTLMLFQQSSAPTGWTKQTTHDNKGLRVVSGTASSGGATAFTTVFGSGKTTGSTTITASSANQTNGSGDNFSYLSALDNGAHTHTLSLDLQYVDLIIASKN